MPLFLMKLWCRCLRCAPHLQDTLLACLALYSHLQCRLEWSADSLLWQGIALHGMQGVYARVTYMSRTHIFEHVPLNSIQDLRRSHADRFCHPFYWQLP